MDGTVTKVNPATAPRDARIRVSSLTFAYARRPVLQDVSFGLESGAIGLLGPNGSGKTTLLRCLLGQVPLPAGKVEVAGLDMASQARRARARLGWMPERGGVIPGMCGVGLVAYLGELSGLPSRDAMQRAHEVLHYVGLADERYRKCEDYSQGMKQRLKLAQALVHDPAWLFLDEPTSGLDPRGRVAILELIRDLAWNKGLGVILSTHLLADVESVCREILVLREGRLLARQDVDGNAREPRQVFEVEGFGDEDAFAAGLQRLEAQVTHQNRLWLVTLDLDRLGHPEKDEQGGYRAEVGTGAILEIAAETGFALRRLRRRPVTLAEEFYHLVEG